VILDYRSLKEAIAKKATSTLARRGRIEIITEILKAASGRGVTKTSLVYKSNLNFTRIRKYIDLLTAKNLLEHVVVEGREGAYGVGASQSSIIYRTTEKGQAVLASLLNAEEIVFGGSDIVAEESLP
jgi:predicted transcriptional regulator